MNTSAGYQLRIDNILPRDLFMISNAASWYIGRLGCLSSSSYFSEVKDPRLVQTHLLMLSTSEFARRDSKAISSCSWMPSRSSSSLTSVYLSLICFGVKLEGSGSVLFVRIKAHSSYRLQPYRAEGLVFAMLRKSRRRRRRSLSTFA